MNRRHRLALVLFFVALAAVQLAVRLTEKRSGVLLVTPAVKVAGDVTAIDYEATEGFVAGRPARKGR